jgi:hypothetical protein
VRSPGAGGTIGESYAYGRLLFFGGVPLFLLRLFLAQR